MWHVKVRFCGERNPNHKLTDKQVKKIRKLLIEKVSQRIIAKMYGVLPQCISDINTGRRRKRKSCLLVEEITN